MKYMVVPEFPKRLGELPAAQIAQLTNVLQTIQLASAGSVLAELSRFGVQSLENDMYVVSAGGVRIFFSFGEDKDGQYILLVDLVSFESSPMTAHRRSPKSDSRLNPTVNSRINPYVNSRLNPLINGQINPFINGNINPLVNGNLNPLVNGRLNPRVNGNINPLVNANINPKINANVNPKINSQYAGPYIYDLGLRETGFVVSSGDDVILLFNESLSCIGVGAKNAIDGYTLFDMNIQWVGQLVPDGQGGFLQYDKKNRWIGIVV